MTELGRLYGDRLPNVAPHEHEHRPIITRTPHGFELLSGWHPCACGHRRRLWDPDPVAAMRAYLRGRSARPWRVYRRP